MPFLHVTATVADYDAWYDDYVSLHDQRADHGGQRYQIYRASEDPDEIVVLIEFDTEDNARSWVEYLRDQDRLTDAEMTDVDIAYLEQVDADEL